MKYQYDQFDAGNGMHSYLLPACAQCGAVGPCKHYPFRKPAVNGVNVCVQCGGDPRICGHFNDARDTYGPFDARNKPNWMSRQLWQEAAQWCESHPDQVKPWAMKGQYPDGSSGSIPFLRHLVGEE